MVAGLAAVALGVGAAYVVLVDDPDHPSSWDPRVEEIAAWVANERDLEFEHPVRVNFLSAEEYTEVSTADAGSDGDDDAAVGEAEQLAFLRALGFVSGDVDLDAASDALTDGGTLAFYDPESEEVYVRGTELTPSLRVTLAHELVHVLQDQQFDLERVGDDASGVVLRALAEGDAGRIEDIYVAEELTDEERTLYRAEMERATAEADQATEGTVPPVLTTVFASPYILGPELIGVLDDRDGSSAIDDALADPPSEEVLFDPPLFGDERAAPRSVSATVPEGVEVLDRGEFGPTTWFLLLGSRLEGRAALAAVDGWGGDEYVTYRDDDRVCVVIEVEADTEGDAEALHEAAASWASGSPEGTTKVSLAGGVVRLRTCDPGRDAASASPSLGPELLRLPVLRTQIFRQVTEAGVATGPAHCYATGVIETFSPEELFDLSPEALGSPDQQAQLADIFRGCNS
jgi:hypothetical protein